MNYTQNEKISQISEKTLVIGIDIASEVQYARAIDWRGIELWTTETTAKNKSKVKTAFAFTNDAEGFEAFSGWTRKIMSKYGKTDVILGIEPTGHYWFPFAEYLKK